MRLLSLLLLLACGEKEPSSDDSSAADDSAAGDDSASDDSGEDTAPEAENLSDFLMHSLYDPADCRGGYLGPFSGPVLATARLTPNRWPYEVSQLDYELADNEAGCKSAIAHEIYLFVSTDSAPPEAPTWVQTLEVGAGLSAAGRVVRKDLDPPLALAEGEHLYVAVLMALDGEESTCINTCALDPGDPRLDRAWQGQGEGSYTWTTLAEGGNNLVFGIQAVGTPVD
ncbi:MAG: hypothetical protein H6741_17800 [Alphaproteobacteria bacterium]|nr:hypothetical protein [Alphaproteobacteria bacterium]MCB9794574.1 hypothetical protein [Alphaproteobacteria bacterium]